MIARTLLRALLAAALLFAPQHAVAQVAVPPLKARVTDLTSTLSSQQQATLEDTLRAFEARKGSQVAVLIVPTTQPETVEQYAVRVEENWKLGRKGIDDGVLLLIAKEDRRLRIEVGYGLEGAIPDAIAKRIIAEDIVPRFKQGDFYGGIIAGTDRILRAIEGEPLPSPHRSSSQLATSDHIGSDYVWLGIIAVIVVASIIYAIYGVLAGAAVSGAAAGLAAWYYLGDVPAGFAVGICFLILSYVLFINLRDGWWWYGGGSGHGGSSSDGGGVFGGGGGFFGGGGASGDWGGGGD